MIDEPIEYRRRLVLVRKKTDPEIWLEAWKLSCPDQSDDGRPFLQFPEGTIEHFKVSLYLNRKSRNLPLHPCKTTPPPPPKI